MIIKTPTNQSISIPVSDQSYRYRTIMGQNNITLYVSHAEMLKIPVGSTCELDGETYTLQRPKDIKKNHTRDLEYTLVFESEQAKLSKYKVRNLEDKRLKFPYTARPKEHLELIVENLNLRDGADTWKIGDCVEAVEQLISYNHTYCLDALRMMADAFDTEWEVKRKTISLRKVEHNKTNPLPLSYRNGFKPGIERRISDGEKAIDILYAQGGDRNINLATYGAKDLLLPINQTIWYDGQHFEDEEGFEPENAFQYTTDPDGYYIYRMGKTLKFDEDSLDCTHIYPQRIGEVSAFDPIQTEEGKDEPGTFVFYDKDLPENLDFSKCRLDGEKMIIRFESGMLAAREFDVVQSDTSISGYNHEKRAFTIIRQEQDGLLMPGGYYLPKPGDKYAVFGMQMPDQYVCDDDSKSGASWDMFRECVRYLYENEDHKFSFAGELDSIYAEKNWTVIRDKLILGGYVELTDYQLQDTDEEEENKAPDPVLIRITGIKDFLSRPKSPQIELSNSVVVGGVGSELKKLGNQEVVNESRNKDAISFTKRNFRDVKETMSLLEAAQLHFSESINPITIHTMLALFGDEGLQFRFVRGINNLELDEDYEIKYHQEEKYLKCPHGFIQHMTLGITEISSPGYKDREYRCWEIAEKNEGGLDPDKAYYLYARVEKKVGGQKGTFVLDTQSYAIENPDDPEYYYLLVGILNSEYEGKRSYVDVYGFTEILPGRITTDKIVSTDGGNYMDFVKNSVRIGNNETYLDFNTGQDGKLVLKGTLVQSQGEDKPIPMGVFRGEYDENAYYYPGDEVTCLLKKDDSNSGTSTYRQISDGVVNGERPTEYPNIWQIVASRGSDGDYFEYRYAKNGSSTNWPISFNAASLTAGGWSTIMPTPGSLEYVWCTVTRKTSDGTLIDNWSTPVRLSGVKGDKGDQGEKGASPAMVYRGLYKENEEYEGTPFRVDVVYYNVTNSYYVASIEAGKKFNELPTSNKWNVFTANFESVATGLLFTEKALIAGFNFYNDIIKSVYEASVPGGNKESGLTIDGKNGLIKLVNNKYKYLTGQNLKQEIILDSELGHIMARVGEETGAMVSSDGIYANDPGIMLQTDYPEKELTEGVFANNIIGSIVGVGSINKTYDQPHRIANAAGVVGKMENTNVNGINVYGGWFDLLKVNGLHLGARRISKSTTLTRGDTWISCENSEKITVTLPQKPYVGQIIFLRQMFSGRFDIVGKSGNTGYKIHTDGSEVDSLQNKSSRGDTSVLVFDGVSWCFNYWGR